VPLHLSRTSLLLLALALFLSACREPTATYFDFPPSAVDPNASSGARLVGTTLNLLPGGIATFYAYVEPATTLVLEAPGPRVELSISLEVDGSPPFSFQLRSRRATWRLPASAVGPARITLRDLRPSSPPREEVLQLDAKLEAATSLQDRHARPSEGSIFAFDNVILYVIDTLRWDRLGIADGSAADHRSESPNLDELAERSLVFRNTRAQAPWTRAAVASLMTGLYPWNHRANANAEELELHLATLAELLQVRGFSTAAFVTNGNVAPSLGFDQGFDHFDYLRESGPEVHVSADELHRRVLDWLDHRPDSRPFFLWVHATDPHAPYTPRAFRLESVTSSTEERLRSVAFITEVTRTRAELPDDERSALAALYDAEIRAWDDSLGRFLDELARRDLLNSSLLVIVADHGEEFYEHGGWQHSTAVYEEQIRVPLLLRFPENAGLTGIVDDPVQQVDVFPTVLDALGVPISEAVDGRPLLPLLYDTPSPRRAQLSSLETRQRVIQDAIVLGEQKFVRTWSTPTAFDSKLYDLGADPMERFDLSESRPISSVALQFLLSKSTSSRREPAEGSPNLESLDPELASILRDLGYIQ
jgi:arylsulfatase A-like enzyme